jgi:hypothetical protein
VHPIALGQVLPESLLREAVDLLVRLVEAAGALVIFVVRPGHSCSSCAPA